MVLYNAYQMLNIQNRHLKTSLQKPEKNTYGPFYVDYQLQNDRWRPVLKRLQKSNLIKQ